MFSASKRGHGYGAYLRNAAPSVLSMVFLSFYTTIDGFFVSREAGPDALAAVNIAIPVACLFYGIAVMMATGAGAIIGERLGAGEKKRADNLFSFASACLLGAATLITVLGLVFIEPLMDLLGSTERLDPHVRPYLTCVLAGTIPLSFKLYLEYMCRTDGCPKTAMWMSFSGLAINFVLDYIFVVPMGLGALGAGLGTTLSMALSCLIGVVHFAKRKNLAVGRFRPVWRDLAKSCSNGMSEMFSEMSTGITTLAFNHIVMRFYGEDGVAAVTVVMYVYYFFISFYMGLSVAAAPHVSYDLGARDYQSIRRTLRYSFSTLAAASVVLTLASAAFAGPIASLFLEPSAAWDITVVGLRWTSLVFATAGFNVFMSAYFTAIGDGVSSAVISSLRAFALVVPALVLLPGIFGSWAIWLAMPLADALTSAVSWSLYAAKGRVAKIERARRITAYSTASELVGD